MTRIRTVAIAILLLLTLLFTPIFSHFAQAKIDDGLNPNIPQPGSIVWGDDVEGSNVQENCNITYYHNDAYLAGWANNPYEFISGVWLNVKNQRVEIAIKFVNMPGNGFTTNSGKTFGNIGIGEDSSKWANLVRAAIYQDTTWVNKTVAPNSTGYGEFNYVAPDSVDVRVFQYSSLENRQNVTYYFSFLTNATKFGPGVFGIRIQIKVSWTEWLFFSHEKWEDLATIYGEYTIGHGWVPNAPQNPGYDEDTKTWKPARFNYTVIDGRVRIKFWYAGPDGNWEMQAPSGNITREDGLSQLLETYPNETYPSASGNDYYTNQDGTVHLEYPFDENMSAGIYVWEVINLGLNGETLYTWTRVVFNNASTLNIDPNTGNITDHPPKVSISFRYTGDPTVNEDLTVVIHVEDDNSTQLFGWITVFYSNNMWMAPPPWLSTMEMFNHPFEVNNGGNATVTFRLRFGGQLNVYVDVKDASDNIGHAEELLMVKDFEGSAGGDNDNDKDKNKWFQFPWESTLNMVILLIGVIAMFSGKRSWQMIGIILFFASFINWGYVWQYITAKIDELTPWIIWRWYL